MKHNIKNKGKRWYHYLAVCTLLLMLCGAVGCSKKEEIEQCESTGCREAVYKDDLCADHYVEKELAEQKENETETELTETPEQTETPESTKSPEKPETSIPTESFTEFNDVKIGDTVTFGTYEQDNEKSNGAEDIEWYVLDRKGDEVLLFSKYCLDSKRYNEKEESVTWENCTLREWLNDEFYDEAFSRTEQSYIKLSSLTNEDDSSNGIEGGAETKDKVFLLSINEVKQYYSYTDLGYFLYCYDSCFLTEATEYAKTKGNKGATHWWLRSPGTMDITVAHVQNVVNRGTDPFGAVELMGNYNFIDGYYIRPAVWLDLNP